MHAADFSSEGSLIVGIVFIRRTCKHFDFKGFNVLVTWLSEYGRDSKRLKQPSVEQKWPKFKPKEVLAQDVMDRSSP